MVEPATAYDAQQFDDNFPVGIDDHYWFRARNAILDRTLRKACAMDWQPARPCILEVGCGTGVVVGHLAARGHDVSGVELGRPSIPAALRQRITTGIPAQALPEHQRAKVDVTMFLDVIEHVPDDVALLRDTLRALPRARCVVVTVPARPEVWSDHDTHYGHYRRYTRASLTDSLHRAGLVPRQLRYLFPSLYAAAGLIKLTGRQRDPILRAPRPLWLHTVLAGLLIAEDRLAAALPVPGLSLLAVATRVP